MPTSGIMNLSASLLFYISLHENQILVRLIFYIPSSSLKLINKLIFQGQGGIVLSVRNYLHILAI